MILDFLGEIAAHPTQAKFVIINKRYTLVAKFVDLVIELAVHARGINLYQQEANIALTNVLYFVLPSLGGDAFFNSFLTMFQEYVRYPRRDYLDGVMRHLMSITIDEKLCTLFELVQTYADHNDSMLAGLDEQLDLTLTAMVQLATLWQPEAPTGIQIIHDTSKAMARNAWLWESLVDPPRTRTSIGYDRRIISLPLGVTQIRAEDSAHWAGLQLTDIIVDAATRYIRWVYDGSPAADTFGQAVTPVMTGINTPQSSFWMWPSPKFTPDALGMIGNAGSG